MRRAFKVLLGIVGTITLVGVAVGFWLVTPEEMIKPDMVRSEATDFVYYYEPQDQANMEKVARALEQNYARIAKALDWQAPTKTTVVVYSNQQEFQHAARGRITDYLGAGWFVGDNRTNAVLITSPGKPNKSNDSNSIVQAAVHEYVHMIEDNINKDLPLYWHEGIAMYLAGQQANRGLKTPTAALPNAAAVFQTSTNLLTSLEFGNNGGYDLSYILIEYVVKEFGVDKLSAIVRDPNHPEQVLGKDYQAIHAGWVAYIDKNYR